MNTLCVNYDVAEFFPCKPRGC